MKASASSEIDRPIDDVFEYVSNVENMDEWVVGVSDTERVSGDGTSVGDRYESFYTYRGETQEMKFEVTEFEPPHRFGITAPEGPFAFDGTLELEATERGTRVTNTIETEADGRFTAFVFTVFRPVMRWTMARRLKQELRELQALLETDTDALADPQTGASGA